MKKYKTPTKIRMNKAKTNFLSLKGSKVFRMT